MISSTGKPSVSITCDFVLVEISMAFEQLYLPNLTHKFWVNPEYVFQAPTNGHTC